MTVLPPYLQAAAAQARIDELIRQADRYRAGRHAATGRRRRVLHGGGLLTATRRVRSTMRAMLPGQLRDVP